VFQVRGIDHHTSLLPLAAGDREPSWLQLGLYRCGTARLNFLGCVCPFGTRKKVAMSIQNLTALMTSIAVTSALASCTYVDPRGQLNVRTEVAVEAYLVGDRRDIIDSTSDVCPELDSCEQAAESARVRMIRFPGAAAAGAYVESLGDRGYQSDRIAIEFLDPTVSVAERQFVTSTVDQTATFSPD
jgi:hypothetical protein